MKHILRILVDIAGITVIAFILGRNSIQKANNNTLTAEYNRGYLYGRQSGFAESYNCYYQDRKGLEKAYVSMSKNVAEMGEISLKDALNYPCSE